jgi:glycosyltransferase involved in cell wall biosynthesis
MNILFIAPLPPPITGHSLAADVLLKELQNANNVIVINQSKSSLTQGISSFNRVLQILKLFIKVRKAQKSANVIYLTISESIIGNLKDLMIYLLCYGKLHHTIIHLHGGSLKKLLFDKYKTINRINKYFIRKLGGAIILGPSHLEIFSGILPLEKIHTVPNFAEDFLFSEESEIVRKFKDTNQIRIFFLSNLIFGKGYNDLVNAYISLCEEKQKKVRIDFAGAFESDSSKIEFLKKIEGLNGIFYHGVIGRNQKKQIFSSSHLFCLPTSLYEGQPISILEAYASGCVVLTTNNGGIPDVFRGKINGFEIESNSSDSIKKVIEYIIDNPTQLLEIALRNSNIAYNKYRTRNFNSSLVKILNDVS